MAKASDGVMATIARHAAKRADWRLRAISCKTERRHGIAELAASLRAVKLPSNCFIIGNPHR